jgi:hypothetical protein
MDVIEMITLARWSLAAGGILLLMQTLFGLFAFAVLGLDFSLWRDITTALSLTLSFPIYLLAFRSLRVATVFLWIFFVAQWANTCLISQPPTIVNPFEWFHGDTLFIAIALIQCGYLLLSKTLGEGHPIALGDAFKK